MKSGFRAGLMAAIIVGGAAGLLPAASARNDPAPRVDIFHEQAQDDAPRVTLPRGVVEAASAYETYLRRAASIRAAFNDGDSINQAMTVAEAYQPEQLEEGVIAYAALIALEDERFVRGVQGAVRGPEDAARAADVLLADPTQAAGLPGAQHAAALIGAVLREDGGHLFTAGRAVKQSAYDIQHQAWSKQNVPDPAARLARAKSLSVSARIPAPEDVSRLFTLAAGFHGRAVSDDTDASGLTPIAQRGLALAALALLGQAADEPRLTRILSERDGADCMKMAKLNLYQCLAVAGPHYEDVFCLGQHAMMDTGQCVASGGGDDPRRMESRLATVRADRDAVRVPVAENTSSR